MAGSGSMSVSCVFAIQHIDICLANILKALTPNDPYKGRTAPLTSKVVFYIFIQHI